jgi:hypothetical protein
MEEEPVKLGEIMYAQRQDEEFPMRIGDVQ